MANKKLSVIVNGSYEGQDSNTLTVDFLSIKVGASGLEVKETGGAFDFSAKKLTNILDGTAATDAVSKGQMDTALALKLNTSLKGAANGLAELDADGKVPTTQLPAAMVGALTYKGTHDASTGSYPASPSQGWYYVVSVAGTISAVDYEVGDWMVYNGTSWDKLDNSDKVSSVNGQTGAVVLTTTNISEGTNLYWTSGRFDTAFGGKTTTNLAEGTNLYYTQARFDTAFGGKTTDNLTEGSTNKYYSVTTARTDLIASAITNGDTTHAPSGDVVYDALALKANDADVVKSVNGVSPTAGAVTIDSDDVGEGSTNLYFTAARAKAAAVADSITNGVTDVAPSQNAVFDALATKMEASVYEKSFINDNASAITIRQVAFIKSNGHIDLAIATSASIKDAMIVLVKDSSIDSAASGLCYHVDQVISGFSGLTPGATYFISASTAGEIVTPAPISSGNYIYRVGRAVSATELRFEPEYRYLNV